LQTELTLLDPLPASVLQFFRLLLPADQVLRLNVRTPEELFGFWGARMRRTVTSFSSATPAEKA